VVTAAGSSQRMGDVDKIFALLGGRPLLVRVIDVVQECDSVDQIVVALSPSNLERGKQLLAEHKWSKVTDICAGGLRRQDSVKNGLAYLLRCQWAIIHDGARPLVTSRLVEDGLAAAGETGAAIAAVPVTDTIKLADERRFVRETLDRQNLWAVQTPQVFRFAIIDEAYHHAQGNATDDAMLVEQLGYKVKLYMGSYDNIKVTTLHDLALAETLVAKRT
ncbi:MAG: 2-C-methyl-D-erythritol 4-phosphate cytidylyltransferase, partial [Chloroflexi bacterium]|nr:2-C-methyl-D-erythritol 4-phosphate cytidylyltransferase [Chloroflexota bacterium]